MANSLQQFLQSATSETIRCTNQFEIEAASGYSDIDQVLQETMIFGQTFTIPSRTVNYAAVSFKGYEVPNIVPTNIDMTKEITMTVLDDVNGSHRRAFLSWMNKVMNFDIEGGSVFEGDRGIKPESLVRLRLFDKDNQTVIQTYKFYNVAVKSVSDISLDYNGGDAAKFDVTFVSTYWVLEENKKGSLTELK